jgi:hypothetical protein
MERRDRSIVDAYNRGVTTREIAGEYGMTIRHVLRILQAHRGGEIRHGKGVRHELNNLRPVVVALMRERGRNFNVCERCGADIPDGKFELHHTKYDDATYDDLEIVCKSCNLSSNTRFLI